MLVRRTQDWEVHYHSGCRREISLTSGRRRALKNLRASGEAGPLPPMRVLPVPEYGETVADLHCRCGAGVPPGICAGHLGQLRGIAAPNLPETRHASRPESTMADRFNHEFGVNVSWDPKK